MLISNFSERLVHAMTIRNKKPIDIVKESELLFKLGKIDKPLNKPLMSYYINGKYEAKQDNLHTLALVLNVDEAWLMGYDVPMEKKLNIDIILPKKVPVLGKISAGLPLYAEEQLEGYMMAPEIAIKDGIEYFYLRVQGDSMNTKFNDGDLVLIQKQDTLENGEIGAIRVNGFDATVKRFKTQGDLIILEPMSTNPIHTVQIYNPKEVDINIIGKVIWYMGKV